MPTFESMTCHKCGSIVTSPTDSGQIKFVCTACPETRQSKPIDTMMASGTIVKSGATNEAYEKIFRYVSRWPYNPRPSEPKKCVKCKKTEYVRYVQLGDQEKKFYGCNCGKNTIDTIFT